jgi:hypothetical protein
MREADFDQFGAMLDAVCSLLSRGTYVPSAANTALWFRALAAHSLDEVRSGFDAHVRDPQRGRFVPTPADIIAQLQGLAEDDGRPGAEEAWAMVLRSRDEAETVVWTREMAEAWAVARVVIDGGDEVGARMAFREAYGRMVDDARRNRMPAAWSVSLGLDPARRADAVRSAVITGRLPQSELFALEPPRTDLQLGFESEHASPAEQQARDALRALSERLRAKQNEPSADALARAQTDAQKAEAAARVAEYADRHRIALGAELGLAEAADEQARASENRNEP